MIQSNLTLQRKNKKNEQDIYEAFDELFQQHLKLNSSVFKKLPKLDLENQSLENKLKKSSNRQNELRVEKESLEVKVKTLTSDPEKCSAQLQSFTSSSKKIDNMLGLCYFIF